LPQGHALLAALVLADGLDDGSEEALVRGAGFGATSSERAALPERREPEQVQQRRPELGAVERFWRVGAALRHPGQRRRARQGRQGRA
jgi:hypothetical protein